MVHVVYVINHSKTVVRSVAWFLVTKSNSCLEKQQQKPSIVHLARDISIRHHSSQPHLPSLDLRKTLHTNYVLTVELQQHNQQRNQRVVKCC